jgi:hypothetical protein
MVARLILGHRRLQVQIARNVPNSLFDNHATVVRVKILAFGAIKERVILGRIVSFLVRPLDPSQKFGHKGLRK